jgi:hypothetical protein
LEDRAILGVTGYQTPPRDGMMRKSKFVFEPETYLCPEGQLLPYATTDRTGYTALLKATKGDGRDAGPRWRLK